MKDCAKVCWSIAPLILFDSGTYSIGTGTNSIGNGTYDTDTSTGSTDSTCTRTGGTGTCTGSTGTDQKGPVYDVGSNTLPMRFMRVSSGLHCSTVGTL